MSDIIEEFLAEFLAQDTKEDGFATLVDSEGQPYVANLNPKEKERYSETGKPLSQVKKEEKAKKEQEQKEAEAKAKKEKEKEDLFEKYWAESASAGLYQKRKEAEENKKTEESKKSEQKNTEPEKSSFKEKLRKILSTPFKKSRSDSTYHEVNPERIRSVVSKLNPDDPKTEEALKELEKYYNEGQAWAVNEVVNNIDNYTSNPESYERKLKANEKSLNQSLDVFNKAADKINGLVQNDLKKFTDFMYERGKTFGSKLSKEQIGEKIKNMLKEGRLRSFMESRGFKSEGLRLTDKIAYTKNSLKSSLESIKNFNPARAPLFSINLQKQYIKDLKNDVENYLKANNMAMDSADFAEIQSLLNELDNGNNGLDLFINNVNEEKMQSLKKTIGLAQDNALTSYFEDIEIY